MVNTTSGRVGPCRPRSRCRRRALLINCWTLADAGRASAASWLCVAAGTAAERRFSVASDGVAAVTSLSALDLARGTRGSSVARESRCWAAHTPGCYSFARRCASPTAPASGRWPRSGRASAELRRGTPRSSESTSRHGLSPAPAAQTPAFGRIGRSTGRSRAASCHSAAPRSVIRATRAPRGEQRRTRRTARLRYPSWHTSSSTTCCAGQPTATADHLPKPLRFVWEPAEAAKIGEAR